MNRTNENENGSWFDKKYQDRAKWGSFCEFIGIVSAYFLAGPLFSALIMGGFFLMNSTLGYFRTMDFREYQKWNDEQNRKVKKR